MANKKFSEFLAATTIDDDIELAGLQVGVNKRFTRALLLTDPNFTGAATFTASESGSPSLDQAFLSQQYCTGTNAAPTQLNHFKIWADNVDAGNAGGSDHFVEGFTHEHYFGGANARGGRQGLTSYLYLTAATSPSNDNGNYVALLGVGTAQATDGGTATNYLNDRGAMFGLGAVGHLAAGATNFINVTAAEFNVVVETGASVTQKTIIQLSARHDDRVKGAVADAMILAANQSALNPKWDYGILFDYRNSPDYMPFNSSSTVLKTGPGTIGTGIDFNGTTVANYAFRSPNFYVDGSGNVGGGNIGSAGNVTAAAGGYHNWFGRSGIGSPADGNITLANSAGTDFTLLQFGGGSSSFPALKRGGADLQVRLADDSGYATLQCLNLGATGQIVAGASAPISFSGRSQIVSTADGYVTLRNDAATGFTMLQLGGHTSSFPALKRSSAALQVVLADDSGLARLDAYFGDSVSTGHGVSTGVAAIELGGLRTGDGLAHLDLHSQSGVDYSARLLRDSGANGNLVLYNAGTGIFAVSLNGANELYLTSTELSPAANDGLALGSTTAGFSDVHLANGAVINFANGNFTLTHSSGILTASGTFAISGHLSLSGSIATAITVGGTYSGSAIVMSGTVAGHAIDFNSGTFTGSMMRLKNNSPIVARNAAGDANHQVMLYDSSNGLILGAGATSITLSKNTSVTDGQNIVLGTTTGTKFGTGTSQKIGFFNATPIVQPTSVTESAAGIKAALISLGLFGS